jgi:hypothetical protein
MPATAEQILAFLVQRLPKDIGYLDLAQLCMGLHINIEGFPTSLSQGCNKDEEAEAFARFVEANCDRDYGKAYSSIFGSTFHRVNEKGHWIEVIASIYKIGDTYNSDVDNSLREEWFR